MFVAHVLFSQESLVPAERPLSAAALLELSAGIAEAERIDGVMSDAEWEGLVVGIQNEEQDREEVEEILGNLSDVVPLGDEPLTPVVAEELEDIFAKQKRFERALMLAGAFPRLAVALDDTNQSVNLADLRSLA